MPDAYNPDVKNAKNKPYFVRIRPAPSTSSKIFVDKKTRAACDRRALNRIEY